MREPKKRNEFIYGLPVFKEEYRIHSNYSDKTKEFLRDKRTHILATCMAAYPFTPTKQLAEEFGISPKSISALASMYGINKSKETRSAINRENGAKTHLTKHIYYGKTVEKVARNGRVTAIFVSASEAARAAKTNKQAIVDRCNGRIKSPLKGYRYRYKDE